MTDAWTFDDHVTDQELLEQVLAFYRERLKGHSRGRQFLADRGLDYSDLPDAFEIGLADRQLGKLLPSRDTTKGRELRDRLTKLGIYRSTGHGHFSGSMVVPLRTLDGQIAEIYGRKISRNLRDRCTLYTYLPDACRTVSGKRGIFNARGLAARDEMIVTDSVLNGLSLWSAGLRNVTCTLGLTKLPAELIEVLGSSGIRRVALAQRSTAQGNEVAEEAAAQLSSAGIETYRVELPEGQDANDYARQAGSDALADLVYAAGRPAKATPARPPAAARSLAEPVAPSNGDSAPDEQPGEKR